jgi:hypothetical protein
MEACFQPGVVALTCNANTLEAKAGGLRDQVQPELHRETPSQIKNICFGGPIDLLNSRQI